ncbi:endonuclease/exonuclease/phosphatase family protein [Flagellimonas myxillae]|uniref:endonuclease/exonuclease/phosphatase family protein n=1 Tax=Flagellimonas myxillae TaxID=2942214 RepID=UPI00201F44B8|nr:endonuclease/exonuclease/phosphatase family protein [Muricauda myxillae]MCL6265444.1 endonuclease/exonuclease/phosphatase family protein [Muricauda myxillae]
MKKPLHRTLIALLLMLIAVPVSAQSEAKDSKIVKVLSFNVLGGRTTKGDLNFEVVAKVIRDIDPDLVAIQEVDFKVNRSRKVDLVTELGYRTNMVPIFARAMYYDGGEYGEGILSRYSFVSTRNVPLPYMEGEEPRSALEVVVELPSKDTIAFVGTHFAHERAAGRQLQAKMVNQVFTENKYPTLLAGDLNARPGSDTINILEEFWTSTYDPKNPEPTYPSSGPRSKIDYIMYHPNNKWRVLNKEVIVDTYASDHCAYLVTLELID